MANETGAAAFIFAIQIIDIDFRCRIEMQWIYALCRPHALKTGFVVSFYLSDPFRAR